MTTKKQLMLAALALMTVFGAADAQVVNRALSFTSGGKVDCGRMPALDNLASYSVQFWINPAEWKADATVLSRGDDFKATLDDEGSVMFTVGTTSLKAVSTDLTTGDWSQLTLICNNGTATALVNGTQVATGTLSAIPAAETPLTLGGGYTGLVDEVRLWNDALNNEMATFDYFTNNTLNKWCPMWNNLLVYYKMDQGGCENLVDYKILGNDTAEYNNHGILGDGVKRVEANNDKMPYLVVAGYTENARFFDRTIPRDEYLLNNMIIILGADCVAATGGLKTRTPNNHATVGDNATYLESYQGREGVLSLDGSSQPGLAAPAATWASGNVDYGFQTWLYLEEWTPGAFIFRKETADGGNGISLRLGDDADNPTLIARVNGSNFVSNVVQLPLKQWVNIGLSPGSGGSVIRTFSFLIDGNGIRPNNSKSDGSTDATPTGNDDLPIFVGENLNGKIDDMLFWSKKIDDTDVTKYMKAVPMPSITKNVSEQDINGANAYYSFDNPENLGFSYHSQDNWANIMRAAYEGYARPKIFLSVNGKDAASAANNFTTIINTAAKRQTFAKALAAASENYDGMELDFEWIYTWTNYAAMVDSIVKYLPEGKEFQISTHNVSYSYPKQPENKILDPRITGFTFQQYGPQNVHFYYQNTGSSFTTMVNNFLNYGYPADKIITSFSTTTSKSTGGKDIGGIGGAMFNGIKPVDSYTPGDQNIDSFTYNGDTWYYMGPMQVYKRAKLTREKNLKGIFYWDMGNDAWNGTPAAPEMHKYNLAKYCNYALSANVDSVVNTVDVRHLGTTGIEEIAGGKKGSAKITVTPSPVTSTANVTLAGGETPEEITVYNMAGSAVISNNDKTGTIDAASLQQGVYLLQAKGADGKAHSTKFVKR